MPRTLQEWCVEARRLGDGCALEVDGARIARVVGACCSVVTLSALNRKFTVPDEALDDLRYAVTEQTNQTQPSGDAK